MALLVIRAANLLSVDEFEVFQLAHRFWHHSAGELKTIKSAFNKYLDKKIVPPWVMHFARTVVRAYDCGDLEPAVFGIYPAFEQIPLSWSLAFNTPLSLPLNEASDLMIA